MTDFSGESDQMRLVLRYPVRGIWSIAEGSQVHFHLAVYPNAFHRLMQRLVFGFVWRRP